MTQLYKLFPVSLYFSHLLGLFSTATYSLVPVSLDMLLRMLYYKNLYQLPIVYSFT